VQVKGRLCCAVPLIRLSISRLSASSNTKRKFIIEAGEAGLLTYTHTTGKDPLQNFPSSASSTLYHHFITLFHPSHPQRRVASPPPRYKIHSTRCLFGSIHLINLKSTNNGILYSSHKLSQPALPPSFLLPRPSCRRSLQNENNALLHRPYRRMSRLSGATNIAQSSFRICSCGTRAACGVHKTRFG